MDSVTVTSVDGGKTAKWYLTTIRTPFTTNIYPITRDRCSACHNASSTIPNWLDSTTAVGKAASIVNRLQLPPSDPKHMPPTVPPSGLPLPPYPYPQPTQAEMKIMIDWFTQP